MSFNDRTVLGPDGTRISYSVAGHGPALVLTNGLTTTSTYWKYLRPLWLRRHTVITWDLPGHGTSGPAHTARAATIEGQPEILARVMDAAQVERATQIGFSVGCQVVLEMARQQAARCDAIVALLGPAGRMLDTTALPLSGRTLARLLQHTPRALFTPIYRVLAKAAALPGTHHLARGFRLAGPRTSNEDIALIISAVSQAHPATIHQLAISALTHSAHDVLPKLGMPMLVVAGESDPFAPIELVGQALHQAAPGSELTRIAKGTHTAMLEDPYAIADAVDTFVAKQLARAAQQERTTQQERAPEQERRSKNSSRPPT